MSKPGDYEKMIGQRLRQAREAAGYPRRSDAAKALKINYNTLAAHESGRRAIDKNQANTYAQLFGVPVEHLLALDLLKLQTRIKSSRRAESGNTAERSAGAEDNGIFETFTIPVLGAAAGGRWLEPDDMHIEQDDLSIPAAPQYDVRSQYARKIVGNSVNRRVRNGEYAIFVKIEHYGQRLRGGELVDCLRMRAGLYEHSAKIFQDGRLLTDSDEFDSQREIQMSSGEDDTTVQIVGVAIGVYRPLYATHNIG